MATSQKTVFKVGKASPANTFLAIWMAEDAGLYAANGLQMDIVDMVGGSETGPALASGRVDLMHIGMSSVVRANGLGFDVRVIGSLSNVVRSALFTAPGVKTAEDLKGGVIGISSTGSESDPTTTLALTRIGLARDNITIKEIGVERLSAVRDGAVQATMLGEPYRSQALAAGLTAIVDLLAERIPWVYSGLVVDRAYLRDHRQTLEAFMRATVEANYLAVSDPERGTRVLARALEIEDPEIAGIAYENFKAATPLNAEASIEGAENIIATVAAPDASHNIGDYVDASVSDRLREEGFFAAMADKYGIPDAGTVR
ncbi:MAG: ABC transporter substrate-binding protein [Alphaproteobacteria bacterium]|nr:ABC transporter substrate-binding protein [Alphaproteobacteria bacterium]